MLPPYTVSKLVELTSRAVSINRELLYEEEKFIDFLQTEVEKKELEAFHNRIINLARKERLFFRCYRINH